MLTFALVIASLVPSAPTVTAPACTVATLASGRTVGLCSGRLAYVIDGTNVRTYNADGTVTVTDYLSGARATY